MANTFSQTNFAVVNKDGKDVLYYTDNRSYNELTLSFINTSQVDITLKGGESTFEFNMAFLRDGDNDPVKSFEFGPSEYFEPIRLVDKKWMVWKLLCKKDLVVPAGKNISFTIKNIVLIHYRPGNFYLTARGVPTYEDIEEDAPMAYGLAVQDLASKEKPQLPVSFSYMDVIHPINYQTGQPCTLVKDSEKELFNDEALPIYVTYDPAAKIKNGFKLVMTTDKDIVIPDVQEGIKKPTIRIMFLFGGYPYQITTAQIGNGIEIDRNQLDWKVNHNEDYPFWECVPLPQTIKANTSFSFSVNGLVTPLNAALGFSIMYVQVNNFGDFADEVRRFTLVKKVADPRIIRFEKDKARITIGENIKLSWDSRLANRLEITYMVRDRLNVVLSTAPKPGEHQIGLTQCEFIALPVPPTEVLTAIIMTAYGPKDTKVSLTVTVDVTQRMAEIRSFKAKPNVIEKGVKTMVTFEWDVQDASQLRIFKGDKELFDVSKTTSKQIEIEDVGEYKLVARSYGDELSDATKMLKLYSLENKSTLTLPFSSDKLGDRPKTLPFFNQNEKLLLVHCGQYELYIISIETNKILKVLHAKNDSFALHPQKPSVAYSQVGKNLPYGVFVYTLGDGDKQGQRYLPMNASAVPMQVRFSPDGKKLYVSYMYGYTMTEGYKEIQCAWYYHCGDDYPKLRAEVAYTVLDGGRGAMIAISEYNGTVYFIPPGANRIAVDNYKNESKISLISKYLPFDKISVLIEPKPASTQNKAYAAFENQETIIVLTNDITGYNSNQNYEKIDVGAQPFNMVLSADEKTLYVACIRENKVIVIDTVAKTIAATYTDIDTPSCLAISENGDFLFIGNHRGRTLTVISLKTRVVNLPLSTGSQAGNPMVLTLFEDSTRYTIHVTKESYSQRTKWTDADIITPNTSLNMSTIVLNKTI